MSIIVMLIINWLFITWLFFISAQILNIRRFQEYFWCVLIHSRNSFASRLLCWPLKSRLFWGSCFQFNKNQNEIPIHLRKHNVHHIQFVIIFGSIIYESLLRNTLFRLCNVLSGIKPEKSNWGTFGHMTIAKHVEWQLNTFLSTRVRTPVCYR